MKMPYIDVLDKLKVVKKLLYGSHDIITEIKEDVIDEAIEEIENLRFFKQQCIKRADEEKAAKMKVTDFIE